MTEAQAFLQAIIDRPDDDGLRLIFSDWLEESGDSARAEFIRISIKLATMPAVAPGRSALADRLQQLQKEHGTAWLESLRMNGRGLFPEFAGGFVERLQCDYETGVFFRDYDHWFRSTPLRELTLLEGLEDEDDGLARLAAIPELSRLKALRLWTHRGLEAGDWAKLFESPNLRNLETLSVSTCGLEDRHVFPLARSPSLAKLKVLDLTYNCVGSAGATALVESPLLRNLKVIYLGDNYPYPAEDDPQEMIRILKSRFELRGYPE